MPKLACVFVEKVNGLLKKAALYTVMSIVAGGAVYAGGLDVTVKNTKGDTLENAVVMLKPLFTLSKPIEQIEKAEMRQQDTLFAPFVLPVTVGTEVSFPNYDEFRHHVYSFSKTKRFEIRLYGKDESNSIIFDEAGVVALGCNIHDNMLAYIYVTNAPIMRKTGDNGVASFAQLEEGQYELTFWHPGVKRKGIPDVKVITIGVDMISEEGTLDMRRVWGQQSEPGEGQY